MTKLFGLVLLFAGLGSSGCLAPSTSTDPQTPRPGAGAASAPRTGEPVATILGPIGSVDGAPVARSNEPIAVKPGCHVVRTNSKHIVSTDSQTLWYFVNPVDFVLETRAGYNYFVERTLLDSSGHSTPVRVTAYEREASGKVTRTIPPVLGSAGRLQGCPQ